MLDGRIADREDLVARGKELGTDLASGGSVVVVRGHPRNPTEDDWRRRLLAVADAGRAIDRARGRSARPTAEDGGEIVLLVPDADGDTGRRVAAAILRELESGLPGFAFAIGRSRHAEDPLELHRARNEALLAANVVEGDPERVELGLRGDRHLPAAAART